MESSSVDLGNCGAFRSEQKDATFDSTMPFDTGEYYMYGHATVLVGDRVYAFGGYHNQNKVDCMYIYRINRNVWSAHKLKSTYRRRVYGRVKLAFVHNDALFAYVWLHDAANEDSYSLAMLDCIEMEGWEAINPRGKRPVSDQPMTGAFHESSGVAYLCNGSEVYALNAENEKIETVETKGAKPFNRCSHACCTSPTSFIMSGGEQFDSPLELHVLELQFKQWSTIRPITGYKPPHRYLFTLSYVNGEYLHWADIRNSNQFDVFSLEENCWRNIVPFGWKSDGFELGGAGLMDGTREHAEVHTKDKMIVFGGFGDNFEIENPLFILPDAL